MPGSKCILKMGSTPKARCPAWAAVGDALCVRRGRRWAVSSSGSADAGSIAGEHERTNARHGQGQGRDSPGQAGVIMGGFEPPMKRFPREAQPILEASHYVGCAHTTLVLCLRPKVLNLPHLPDIAGVGDLYRHRPPAPVSRVPLIVVK